MRISSFAYDNAIPAPLADLVVTYIEKDVSKKLPVPLRGIAISGSLAGPIAGLRIEHLFDIPANTGVAAIDACYTFPIPGDAAVQGVTMHFGDEEIKALLHERQEARDEFERAKETGRAAVLVNDSGRGVLTLEVTGITPGVPLRVMTELVVLPRAEADGTTALRIPLTAAPRYTRDDEDSTAADASPRAITATVDYQATLELSAPSGIEISSPTHEVVVTAEGGKQLVTFTGPVSPDRDLVIVSRDPVATALAGRIILGETRDGRTPWIATVTAPAVAPGGRVPRSLLLLVDRSGSMGGSKWSAASWATRSLIAGMRDDDEMISAVFDTSLEWNTEGRSGMNKAARKLMADWIRTIAPRGGTQLGSALEEMLRQERRGDTQNELLIITDGDVSDDARIMALADSSGWRISVLCIDSAPNAALAMALAERGGGECWFLTSGAGGDEITDAVNRIVGLFGTPSVGNLALLTPGSGGAIGRRSRAVTAGLAIEVGALPAGAVRSLGGWTDGDFSSEQFDIGVFADGDFSPVDATSDKAARMAVETERNSAVNALVAAWQIRTLEHAATLANHIGQDALARAEADRAGIDVTSLPNSSSVYEPVPGSRSEKPLFEALRKLIIERSLAERVISSHTAFVGIRHKIGDKSEGVVEVPSMLPAGWAAEGFAEAAPMMRGSLGGMSLKRSIAPSAAPSAAPSGALINARMASSLADPMISFASLAEAEEPEARVPLAVELFAGSVADLRMSQTVNAPEGSWRGVRVTGDVDAAEGIFLVIWDRDRTRPLLRARLADLLAAGERPAKLTFAAGGNVSLALEGGTGTAGDLVIELLETL